MIVLNLKHAIFLKARAFERYKEAVQHFGRVREQVDRRQIMFLPEEMVRTLRQRREDWEEARRVVQEMWAREVRDFEWPSELGGEG